MSAAVLVILAVSTFLHAGWNLLARHRKSDAPYFMFQMYVVIAAVGLVPFVAAEFAGQPLPLAVWSYAAVSGLFSAVYSLFLTKGYVSADFTVVYPVARALPVLMVGLGDTVFGRFPTPTGWTGMALVTVGCFLAPLHSFGAFHPGAYFRRATAWMLLAALGTVGYTLVDKTAVGLVTPGPAAAARYGFIYFVFSGLFYAGFWPFIRRRKTDEKAPSWRTAALGAVMIYTAYALVLWAYQVVGRASYVVAFRQFSIVIGVVLAFVIYKEKGRAVRIAASLLIAVGLVIIALWGTGAAGH